jgi:hypothetical protein
MLVLLDELPIVLALPLLISTHPRLVERAFPALPDLGHTGHCLESGLDQVAVVSDGDVAALGESEGGVDGHFLAVRAAERFCPGEFAGVTLHFEVLVAFGFAEAEGFGVVAHCEELVSVAICGGVGRLTESDALGRVHRRATEVARFDPHGGGGVALVVVVCEVEVELSVAESRKMSDFALGTRPISMHCGRVFRILTSSFSPSRQHHPLPQTLNRHNTYREST